MDYFGPLPVTVGRRVKKTVDKSVYMHDPRTIHTEVVHSLDMSSCIMAIRMLMTKRDVQPIEMRSDNATCSRQRRRS